MLIWYGAGVFASLVVAWLVAAIHASGHAPLGLVSLGVGVALGAILSAIAAGQRLAGTKRLFVCAFTLAIFTVVAQHAWLYLDFRRQWQSERQKSAQVAMFRPETPTAPLEYFEREWSQSAALWCVDGAIITASAVGTVFVLRRENR